VFAAPVPRPGGCPPHGRTAGRGEPARYLPVARLRWRPPARQGSPRSRRGGRGCREGRGGLRLPAARGGACSPLVEVGGFLPIPHLPVGGGVVLPLVRLSGVSSSLRSSGSDERGRVRAPGCRWAREPCGFCRRYRPAWETRRAWAPR